MNESEKFNEIFNAVCDIRYKYMVKNGPRKDPEIAIYIDHDYFDEVMGELFGVISSAAYEFFEKRTISGFPVFVVIDQHSKVIEHKHSPWKVVLINGDL